MSSTERKAVETATLMTRDGPSLLRSAGLGEVEHPWYERQEDHQGSALEYLVGGNVVGWEPAVAAAVRFSRTLESVQADEVVAVSHGTVMTLWAQTVVEGLDACQFWAGLTMPDAWRVELNTKTAARVPNTSLR